MALTTADHALALYRNDRFRGWIMVMLGNISREVYGEPSSVPNHVERMNYARKVLLNPTQYVERFLNALIGDPEVAVLGSIPDSEWTEDYLEALKTKMQSLWTPVAVEEAAITAS